MPYTVYILHSLTKDKFYIGYTANLTERIIRHNQKSKGFTGSINDWILVYQEEFNSQSEAIQRERQIKNWKSKIKIKELIQKNKQLDQLVQSIPISSGGSGVRTPFRNSEQAIAQQIKSYRNEILFYST
ncbi:GIY-YIG nuclease family protein [Flavobacterium sp.]|uniref:GIY-YIG nuclease family protein n=1 Tax=Flavobacterium sp. TaxID=239 RepID=UPI00404873F0